MSILQGDRESVRLKGKDAVREMVGEGDCDESIWVKLPFDFDGVVCKPEFVALQGGAGLVSKDGGGRNRLRSRDPRKKDEGS